MVNHTVKLLLTKLAYAGLLQLRFGCESPCLEELPHEIMS